jgi:hypothetical protein
MIAIAIVLVSIAIYYFIRRMANGRWEGFTSRRAHEVHQSARELFNRTGGAATYSEYKSTIRDADPVSYTDTRHLWQVGRLSPEEVAKVI